MDERLEAFREVAELRVERPAFEGIEQRGRTRRLRRRAAVSALAASTLAATGFWAATANDPNAVQPADPAPSLPVEVMFMGVDEPPAVTYDRPDGWAWQGWGTDNRPDRARDLARFAAVIVERVAKDPCQITRGAPDYRPTATDPQQLADQLASMARVQVVQGPSPDDRFRVPALHLQLRGTGPACSGGEDPQRRFMAYQDDADGGGWPDPLGTADVWILDVDEHLVVVETVTGTRVSVRDADTLARILDSVEIDPS